MSNTGYDSRATDEMLQPFKAVMANDYDKYRNHVCRVYLNCLLLDNDKNNERKYAIAAVFHDIGIWTNNTIDYLNPSIEQAMLYLTHIHKEDWKKEIELMIYWHHKTAAYKGEHETIVENFRKADWIDVSLGLLSFGAGRKSIKNNRKLLPNSGFHLFLLKKISKNFLRHPFNPLPMFK